MALPELNLSTPEEFVNYYYDQLRSELGVFDLQISKVGFIGYLLNILGYTHYDMKTYYDSLFKEAFVATAQTEEAQFVHASIYGYLPTLGNPSSATGTIEFDMLNFLPKRQSGVVRREVLLGYGDDGSGNFTKYGTTVTVQGHQFIIDATYKFVEVEQNALYYYYVDIETEDGTKINLPSSSSTIVAPLYSTSQYINTEVNFTIKKYDYGSYQTFYFNIDSGQYLADLEVYINGEQYDVKYIKYLEKAGSKTVFLRKITNLNYVIEFGSGVRGNWVSGQDCKVIIKSCEGEVGNLVDSTNSKLPTVTPYTILCYDYTEDANGNLVQVTPKTYALQNPLVSFSYSEAGKNSLTGEDLRDSVIAFIQTRDNFISENDFYNIAQNYLTDFKFLFKKFNVFDNIFQLCRSFRNKQQEIIYSTNYTNQIMNTKVPVSDPVLTELLSSGTLDDGTYGYVIIAVDFWGRTIKSTETSIILSGTGGTSAIQIDWLTVPFASSYKVYGRTPTNETMYWEVTAPTITYTDDGTDGTPEVLPLTSELTDMIYRPTFTINGEIFISPFLYKGNTRMGYYDGFLMNDLSVISFADTTLADSAFGTGFDIPSIYLNLSYDESSRFTEVRLKSYQDISSLVFNFSVYSEGVSISNQRMEWDDINEYFTYDYYNPSTFGIFDKELQIEVIGGVSSSVVGTIEESYVINGSNDTFVIKFNNESSWTTITLTHGTRTATEIANDINTAYGSIVASAFNNKVKIIAPGTFPAVSPNVYKIYIGLTGNTALAVLGFTGNDTIETILNGPLTIEKFRSKTEKFFQILDVSDQIRLFKYYDSSNSYLINIPVILKSIFDEDPDYYITKLKNFIVDMTFNENRMVTDITQCRLLNSYVLESPYIEAMFTQGGEIYSSISYTFLNDVLSIRNDPPVPALEGSRYLVGSSPTGDFIGHTNDIATYSSSIWNFYTPVLNNFIFNVDEQKMYMFDGSIWTTIPPIQLPFKISVTIKADKNYVEKNNINLADEKEMLQATLADLLQKTKTGSNISYYNSQIIDFIHQQMEAAKSVKVNVTDSSTVPVELDNGIEVRSEDSDILSKLVNKIDIVKYVPSIIYWDINNINISILVE